MKVLRTPDERFASLPGYPFAPHYTDVPDGEGGTLRVHHLDEGPADGTIVLCIHGQPTWSYLYRHMIPILVGEGLRVIAPDLVGYGRSDKPSRREDYSYQRQVDWMNAWLVQNDFRNVTFFGQDWGGLIGLRLVAENEERFDRVCIGNTGLPLPLGVSAERAQAVRDFRASDKVLTMADVMAGFTNRDPNAPELGFAVWQKFTWDTEDPPVGMMLAGSVDGRTLSPGEIAAYEAPFPDASYKMAARAMPSQVPTLSDDPSVAASQKAWAVFDAWKKPFLCAFSDNDPVTGGGDKPFRERVPGAQGRDHPTIQGGGHFLQEGRGDVLAKILADFVKST